MYRIRYVNGADQHVYYSDNVAIEIATMKCDLNNVFRSKTSRGLEFELPRGSIEPALKSLFKANNLI